LPSRNHRQLTERENGVNQLERVKHKINDLMGLQSGKKEDRNGLLSTLKTKRHKRQEAAKLQTQSPHN
jgi:hypothetical protein